MSGQQAIVYPPQPRCMPRGCNRYTPCGLTSAEAQPIPQRLYTQTSVRSSGGAVFFEAQPRAREDFLRWLRETHGVESARLRITGPVADGFWVRALWVLAHSAWARAVGLNISVAYRSEWDSYHDASRVHDDGFTQYFEPLEHAPAPGATPLLLQLECSAAARLWEDAGNYALTYGSLTRQRRARAALMQALPMRPLPRFTTIADAFWSAHFAPGQPVLGVHLRGTDKQRWKLPVERYAPLVRAYLCHEPTAAVLVATDDAKMLARFTAILPPSTRIVVREALRGNGTLNAGVHAKLLGHTPPMSASRLGTDALVDTLLLSRCSFLLKSISAVSEFAVYLSATLRQNSYDLNFATDPQQPMPSWAGACRPRGTGGADHILGGVAAAAARAVSLSNRVPWSVGGAGSFDVVAARVCHTGFRSHFERHTYPPQYAAAPELPAAACNERAEYERQCRHVDEALSAQLRRTRGVRALHVVYAGKSSWGLGHVLALSYRLHDLCRHLGRYCLLDLYDMQLGRLFGYANGDSWRPSEAHLQSFAGSNASTYQIDGRSIERMYETLEADDAPLIVVRVGTVRRPASPLESRMELALPLMPWDLSALDGVPMRDANSGPGSWRHRPPVGARPRPRGADGHLTRCFCRFVSQPRFEPPPTRHRTTYHLRTGFADVPDSVLAQTAPNSTESGRWAALACPGLAAAGSGGLGGDTHFISDSPGLVRSLHPAAAELWTGTTRSWDVSFGARRRAALDAVLAGRSTLVFATYPSSFLRPAIARSVCVRHVLAVDHPASSCAPFPRAYPRGLYDALRTAIRRRARGQRRPGSRQEHATEDNWACFMRLAPKLVPDHPCLMADDPAKCSERFVGANA